MGTRILCSYTSRWRCGALEMCEMCDEKWLNSISYWAREEICCKPNCTLPLLHHN